MLKQIITEIENRQNITREQLALLLETTDTGDIAFLHERARKTADAIYGKQVFIRGLIEFTNYCKNDCIYCGIRKSNRKAERYRLTEEEILSCCANGYELGFRTFSGTVSPSICASRFLQASIPSSLALKDNEVIDGILFSSTELL